MRKEVIDDSLKEPIAGDTLKDVRKKLGLNQSEMATIFGVSRVSYVRWEHNEIVIPTTKRPMIHKFLSDNKDYDLNRFIKLDSGNFKLSVPFVSTNQYAAFIETNRKDWNYWLEFVFNDKKYGNFVAFEIDSSNMDNGETYSLKSGDIALSKSVSIEKFESEFESKEMYIIALAKSMICTRIDGFNKEKNKIKCHSLKKSPEYKDFELKLDDVIDIFKVVKRVTTF